MSATPRLVPDHECKQGKCGATTTGCWDECSLKRCPVHFVVVPSVAATLPAAPAPTEQAGELPLPEESEFLLFVRKTYGEQASNYLGATPERDDDAVAKMRMGWMGRAALAARQATDHCAMCNDAGVVGRPPDDYFDCPDCVAARQVPTEAPKERAINDWLALTIRNTAFAEAAELFPQPYMEYFGENIQATIRAQISQYAQPNLRPTLSNEEIDRITSRFKQADHHDSIRACIAAVFAKEQAQ